MIRRIFLLCVVGLLVSLATVVAAAEPPSKASNDVAAELKAAQAEQVKTLTQLVEVLTAQYKTGTVDFAQFASAEAELCNAQLDATDGLEKRIALLTRQLDRASDVLKLAEARLAAGTVAEADVFRAKSQYLDIRIKLLREKNKKSPTNPAGIRPLGSHLKVDEHGIIWDGEKPVGTWGLDAEPNPAR